MGSVSVEHLIFIFLNEDTFAQISSVQDERDILLYNDLHGLAKALVDLL